MSDQAAKITVYRWPYEDGSVGYCVYDPESDKPVLKYGVLSPGESYRKVRSELKAQYGKNNRQVVSRKLKIQAGLAYVSKPKWDNNRGVDGLYSLKQMLSSCGSDHASQKTIMTLIAAILAGYCSRITYSYFPDQISNKDQRAPIITVKYADFAYPVLERISASLCINTAIPSKLKPKYCNFIPQRQTDQYISDCAYVKFPHCPKHFPAQYRDTALLIHSNFFSAKDLTVFQRQNPWSSLILYDYSPKKAFITPVKIDGRILAKSDCNWDWKMIAYLVQRYVWFLAKQSQKKQRWKRKIDSYYFEIDKLVKNYNDQTALSEDKIRRTQKYQIELQLLAIRLFLQSFYEDGLLNKDEKNEYMIAWYNLILPGCCSDSEDIFQDDKEESVQEIVESALVDMLSTENDSHFLLVNKGESCDIRDPDKEEFMYWGYLRMYTPRNKKNLSRATLQFRRDTLIEILSQFYDRGNPEILLDKYCKLKIDYLFHASKMRLPEGKDDKRTVRGLIFDIKKMKFLPEERVQELLSKFPSSEIES